MALTGFLARNGLKLLRSPGDGHCLLHSMVSSWNSQLPSYKAISMDSIKADVFVETIKNADAYDPYMGSRFDLTMTMTMTMTIFIRHLKI